MTTRSSVMLAAGGTGGHLFPAFALAEELARRDVVVDLITDMRGDRYGAGFPAREVYQVPAATLANRSAAGVARTALALGKGIKAAHGILGRVKPAAVIGFGGYPTYPPLIAARLRSIPTAMHEQNAVLGRANRMLARGVNGIATTFDDVKGLDAAWQSKVTLTGNPVRSLVIDAAALPYASLTSDGPIRLVIFGGSQGARYFSDVLPDTLRALPEDIRRRLEITQQAREEDLDRVRQAYAQDGITADVQPFFKDLPNRLAAAHLVIARAGASTVAELAVIGRASILVPLPHAVDGDQLNNARRIEQAGAGWCMEQKDITPERLASELAQLFSNPKQLEDAAQNAKRVGRPDAVSRLADFVLALSNSQPKTA